MRNAWIITAIVVLLGGGYVAYMNVPSDAADTPDGTMMEDDSMMKKEDSMMKKDDAMMEDKDGEWTDGEMKAMEGGDHMMEDDSMMKKEDSMMKAEEPVVAKTSYKAYSSDVLMNGETKVLFFHAAWCPTCKKGDASLNAWYAANMYSRSAYKVDYDTSADLKAKYGVTYQHTFVLVDGQGNALKTIQGPTDAQILELLNA